MAIAKEVKEQLQFNAELTDLLEVMKDIAVFQFRSMQRRRERFEKFISSSRGFFRMVDFKGIPNFFLNRPRTEKKAVVIVTSDEGFMGGLNFNVLTTALSANSSKTVKFIVVGERGARYLSESGREFAFFKGAVQAHIYNLALGLKNYIIKGLKNQEFSAVEIFYPRSLSFTVQKVECLDILMALGMREWGEDALEPNSVIIESPIEGIVEYLVETYVLEKLIEVIEDSKLSEFAARAIQLEKSGQGLEEQKKALQFQYFRAHHEAIDKNIRDLVSGLIIRKRKL